MTKRTKNIPGIGIAEVSEFIPSKELETQMLKFADQAEEDISKKQITNVTFRWYEAEVKRAKAIAEKLGMPYQTYLKSKLKQAMDNDERMLM